MFSQKMLEMLAIDLALLILVALFYILLLFFREYKKISEALNRFSLSHQNIEDQLSSLNEIRSEAQNPLFDNNKLDKLIAMNSKIEAQFNCDLLDKGKQLHFNQKDVQQLNKSMKVANAFIKTLKLIAKNNDSGALEGTQENLAKQSDQYNKLRVQAEKITVENTQLKKQLKKHLHEIKKLRERGELYTKKLIQQGKELEILKEKYNMKSSDINQEEFTQQIEQLNSQLTESKEELERISIEKEFLETQFLDILEQYEKDEGNNQENKNDASKGKKNILI
jgi:chromosome segregation ATPase